MKKAAMAARVGNRILSIMAGILILLMLSYGMYSLWDTYKIYADSFADEELLKFRPTDDGADNPTLKDLKKLNPDVKAWIQVPKTNIDYPVVQGQDDMEYINKNVYGEFELSGAIFLSCLNKDDFSDPYNLVYGHNMKNGSMFAGLKNYSDQSYAEAHPYIYVDLADGSHCYEIFSAHEADATDITYTIGYRANDTYASFLDSLKTASLYDTGVEVTKDDSVISLSTCTKSGEKRFVVHAKKLY